MRRVSLAFEDWRAEIGPQIGGSILSLTRARVAILRPTQDEAIAQGAVRRTACYPLVPYANRIAAGRFLWEGAAHTLDGNFPNSPHPLHGVGWRRPWQVLSASEHSCELRLEHRPQGLDQRDWPFAFDAEQNISLGSNGLVIQLSIVNAGDIPAPLGMGLHPFFLRRGSERLTFAAAGAWRNGADMLPSSPVSGALWDHVAGQTIGAQVLDNDFFGWSGTARIESNDAPTIRMSATPVFSMLHIFTPAEQGFFAVEPVSHLTDGINRTAPAGTGMLRAPPGARLAGTVTIDADPS